MDAVHFIPQSRPRQFNLGVDAAMHIPASLHGTPARHSDAVIRAHDRLAKFEQTLWR